MTDLQASLIVIGGTIVAGVVTYNKWQEYKAKKTVERAFSSEHDDVLMAPENTAATPQRQRHEPSFGDDIVDLPPMPDTDQQDAAQPGAADLETPAEAAAAAPAAAAVQSESQPQSEPQAQSQPQPQQRELPVDEVIDCLVPLALAAPARGEKILPRLQSLRHVGNKPVHFVGQCDDGNWEPIAHGGIYYQLIAAVQQRAERTGILRIHYPAAPGRRRH
jgi:FtsZ-interacting cell division protein ZipA